MVCRNFYDRSKKHLIRNQRTYNFLLVVKFLFLQHYELTKLLFFGFYHVCQKDIANKVLPNDDGLLFCSRKIDSLFSWLNHFKPFRAQQL